MSNHAFESISSDQLVTVAGGADNKPSIWNDLGRAGLGAVNMVRNPIGAAARGLNGVAGARSQGHSWGDSVANGLVQGAGTFGNTPNLSHIPAK